MIVFPRPPAVVAAAFACVLTSCGYIGDPLYPALNIPVRITDVAAIERGTHIDVYFTVPALTTEGLAIKEYGAIDLRAGPNPGQPFNVDVWSARARSIPVSPPQAPGQRLVQVPIAGFIGEEVIIGVRLENSKGRYSDWSNLAVVRVEPALQTPTALKATPVADGVRLEWKASGEPKFRVYRKLAGEKEPSPLETVTDESYLDKSVEYGQSYEYYVQGLNGTAESEAAGPLTVAELKDTFPPAAPAGLTAAAGLKSIELTWDRNTEPDFAGYRVYRAAGSGPLEKIADALESPDYSDKAVASGQAYRYAITAYDKSGNESGRSQIADGKAP